MTTMKKTKKKPLKGTWHRETSEQEQEFLKRQITEDDMFNSFNKCRSLNLKKFLMILRKFGYSNSTSQDPEPLVKKFLKEGVCSKRTAYDYAYALIFISNYHYANMQIHVKCGARFAYPYWFDWIQYGGIGKGNKIP